MDLNELKNLNMQDLKAKVLAFADKKTLIKIATIPFVMIASLSAVLSLIHI